MISLGVNIGHDRSAAIVKDGVLIGAIAQERLDRIKHSPSIEIPYQAIDSLLDYHKIMFSEIKYIGISSTAVDSKDLLNFYSAQLIKYYNSDKFELIAVPHHLSHAYAAYHTSDFEEAIILVADGGGELYEFQEESESIFIGKNNDVTILEQRFQTPFIHPMARAHNYLYPFMSKKILDFPVSIGKKYEQVTQLIGFGTNGEGKTMGLAAYGNDIFSKPVSQINNINFELTFGDILVDINNSCMCSKESYYTYINNHRADIAQSIQQYTENQILELVRYMISTYKIKNICLAGGLFLNCPMNHKILEQNEDVVLHICPATGDDGQAIGNAFAAYHKFNEKISNHSSNLPYLGLSYSNEQIENAINEKKLNYELLDTRTLAKLIAKELYNNKIIGFFYGRSEIGPRALCHRSILANPLWEGMKDYLNKEVKHRETFRPFAPAVKNESQFEIFDLKQESPYMLLSSQVKGEYKPLLPSITHVDGSARVQAVYKKDNELMYFILEEFEKISGVPVVLNTSFNDNGEPIVESPEDAIKTFLLTNIDILVMNNYIMFKNKQKHNL